MLHFFHHVILDWLFQVLCKYFLFHEQSSSSSLLMPGNNYMTSSIKHWFWCLFFFSALTYWFWVNSSFSRARGFSILFLISLSTHQKFWSDGSYAIRFGSLIKLSAVGGHQFRSGIKQINGWLSSIFFDEISNNFLKTSPPGNIGCL